MRRSTVGYLAVLRRRHEGRTEKLHGAYLAYTQGDAHENPNPEEKGGERRPGEEKTVRGGKGGQGRKITQGRKQLQRKCPLVQQTPALSNSNGAVARKSAA